MGFRYSTEGRSRTLYSSADASTLRALHPESPRLQWHARQGPAGGLRAVHDLPGAWNEIPESSFLIVQPGEDESAPFRPHFEAAETNGAQAIA